MFETMTVTNEIYIRVTTVDKKVIQMPISNIGRLDEGKQGGTNIFHRYYNSSVFVTQSPDEIINTICEIKKEKS